MRGQAVGNHHWRGVESLLRRWLAERQRLLSQFCSLSAELTHGKRSAAQQHRLDRFCETLVDYVSAGHFEVYLELLEEGARRGVQQSAVISRLYAAIVPTTAAALDFNDRYLNGMIGPALRQDLSVLGQTLAARFDWEDALIRHLHVSDRAVA
jgi:regulator of sigma D